MNSYEITESVNKFRPLKTIFKGVFARDTIPFFTATELSTTFCFIVNLDKHNNIGSHWIAVFAQKRKPFMEYFDSFGRKPSYNSIKQFLSQRDFYFYNNRKLQSVLNTTCGQYCLFYLICRALDIKSQQILSFFDKDNSQFNDYLVNETVNAIFKVNYKVSDKEFIISQIKEIWKRYGVDS